ncbi:MAG: hypothetical protein P8P77_03830 [Crocinitomicaceae bacterium]|nr:hypothetical protein [Crocinitomicaceae bacterium]
MDYLLGSEKFNFEKKRNSLKITLVLFGWLTVQFIFNIKGLYSDFPNSIPPKIALFGIAHTSLVIAVLFFTHSGRTFIDRLPLKQITYLNVVRIPVEIVLFSLAFHQMIPVIMSFEGLNFDIFAGTTASLIAYCGYTKMKIGRSWILLWNIISLGLLITIIIIAILSAPSPFQKIIFDRPEFALFFFPITWLPTFVVPMVLSGHFGSIHRLVKRKETNEN